MIKKKIALFGGSFNPPGKHHLAVAETLAREFDEVVVIPCGPRPDKPGTNDIETLHRAAMADLTFRHLPNVRVDHFDLEQPSFTRNLDLENRYGQQGEVWHVVGTDIIQGGSRRESLIHKVWHNGPEIWERLNYAIFRRPEFPVSQADLPPNHRIFEPSMPGSSTAVRERIWRGEDFNSLVVPEVAGYIRRYGLYRGIPPVSVSSLELAEPKPMVVFDERNPEAASLAEPFLRIADEDRPNCIVVIGGDGAMLAALREHWPLRLPFFGVNVGHRGYLLNDRSQAARPDFLTAPARARLLPLLYSVAETVDGQHRGLHAVNDAWVERATGQAAWLEVSVNGQVKLPKLVADGILLSTAHGSNAYAAAMGARPLSVDARELLLVSSNSTEPIGWKSAPLSLDATVRIRGLDPDKRPVKGFVDGYDIGPITEMTSRVSRVAAVELVFTQERDIAAKLSEMFFPG